MALTVVLRLTDGDGDIVAASLRHYLREGVDRVVLVDESSADDVRRELDASGEGRNPAVAYTRSWQPEGDGWRLDAVGGEFWIAAAHGERLADAFERIPRRVGRVDVPVVGMTGTSALAGDGLGRLTFRHEHPGAGSAGGLPPTRTALRAGDESPAETPGIEVLRLADRSVEQVRARAGGGHAASIVVGRYLLEAPTAAELKSGIAEGRVAADDRLADLGGTDVALPAERETDELRSALAAGLARIDELEPLANRAAELEAAVARLSGRAVVRAADAATRLIGGTAARTARGVQRSRSAIAEGRRRRIDGRRASAVDRLLEHPIEPAVIVGTPSIDAVPIVMCLWNRPARFADIVRMIAAQQTERPVRLILWNNAPAHHAEYERQLSELSVSPSSSVELFRSPANIGGVARFVIARRLWLDGARGPFIMLDDDQQVEPDFVDTMLAEYEPHSISAWWAFGNHGSHWKRSELSPGEPADYAGTGGTVADLEIVADPSFFELPPRFMMLEDQWMTFVARGRGWPVRKSGVAIRQVMEEESGNQYHSLRALKDDFYAYLYGNR